MVNGRLSVSSRHWRRRAPHDLSHMDGPSLLSFLNILHQIQKAPFFQETWMNQYLFVNLILLLCFTSYTPTQQWINRPPLVLCLGATFVKFINKSTCIINLRFVLRWNTENDLLWSRLKVYRFIIYSSIYDTPL